LVYTNDCSDETTATENYDSTKGCNYACSSEKTTIEYSEVAINCKYACSNERIEIGNEVVSMEYCSFRSVYDYSGRMAAFFDHCFGSSDNFAPVDHCKCYFAK